MNKIIRFQIVFQALTVFFSLFGVLFTYFVYYQPRLDSISQEILIMRQSLEKEVYVIMTVTPSYEITLMPQDNGTVEERHSILTLSKTQNRTFTIYVSNVGNAFAHILYYSVFLSCDSTPKYRALEIPFSETMVLKPYESTSFEYIFNPSRSIPSEILLTTHHMNMTFTLGSAEAKIHEVVFTELL
jgi:hypothetical protein